MENTVHEAKPISDVEDHLHIRGEYTINNIYSTRVLGSPPHTWRILSADQAEMVQDRITSTYVENTDFVLLSNIKQWDHLHIRGEYAFFFFFN